MFQVGVKNQFGYVRSKPETGNNNNSRQQPPIARPVTSNNSQQQLMPHPQLSSSCTSPLPQLSQDHSLGMPGLMQSSPMMQNMVRGLMDHQQQQQQHQQLQRTSSHSLYNSHNNSHHLEQQSLSTGNLLTRRYNSGDSGHQGFSSSHLSSLLSGASIADLASSSSILNNPYEKWSNGADSLFSNLPTNNPHHGQHDTGFNNKLGLSQQASNDSLLDLSSKFMSQTCLSSPPLPPGTPISNTSVNNSSSSAPGGAAPSLYPLKSQIKRQKMIYHCKFGEFGILEGQFTEPSGVAVNAQNDIIVADTNNHRIQIFDKEGRFKFQFGEVGKRDGQLLYPNRVAVVKNSGDIIVTERWVRVNIVVVLVLCILRANEYELLSDGLSCNAIQFTHWFLLATISNCID